MSFDAESDPSIADSQITAKLSAFVSETPASALPATATESAKQLILDTVGVALAASSHPIGEIITSHVVSAGADRAEASVFGSGGVRVSAPLAALANGTMANALDYDGGGHIPTHMLPAALAVAEEHGVSGQDLLTAFVLGFEATIRLTKVVDRDRTVSRRGWWHVGLIGPVAAAMTVGRLRGLDKESMARAIAISTASSAGFRRNMGTMAKAYHSGNAARGGVEAVQLAQLGFTGDPEIIEAPRGLMHAVCSADHRDPTDIDRLGSPFALERSPGVKDYPAVTPSHGVIDATLELRSREDFSLDEIESVEADFHRFSLFRVEAVDVESAGFCTPFLIAVALIHGVVDLDHMTEKTMHDPALKELMEKIEHVPGDDDLDKVVIRLKGKRDLVARAKPGRRVTSAEAIEAKFKDCARSALEPAAAEELMALILDLEEQPSIDRVMALASGRA